jgi:predicted nicotinamide N-methyase
MNLEAQPIEDSQLVERVIRIGGHQIELLHPRDSESLIDQHAFEQDELLPYWAELWPSGLQLAHALTQRRLSHMRIVELGCGLGLPSLIAAAEGAHVLATDWSAAALALLQRNAARNRVRLQTMQVSWASPRALIELAPFDLVLAADVCYERRNVALLLDLMPRLATESLLADPRRSFTDAFLEQAPRFWCAQTSEREGVAIHRLLRHRS